MSLYDDEEVVSPTLRIFGRPHNPSAETQHYLELLDNWEAVHPRWHPSLSDDPEEDTEYGIDYDQPSGESFDPLHAWPMDRRNVIDGPWLR